MPKTQNNGLSTRSAVTPFCPPAPRREATGQLSAMGKAFSILEVIAASRQPMTMAEIMRACGLTKPTAHRITTMLADMGLIERDTLRRGFVEGPRFIKLSLDTIAAAAPRNRRHAILRHVSEKVGETCNFGILVGSEVLYVDRVEAKWPLGLRFEAGSRVPAHCTAIGKLLLALLPTSELAAVVASMPLTRYTSHTVMDPAKLVEALDRIRRTRVGIDNGEFIDGVVCVSVPVITQSGQVVGAIAVSAPQARVSLDQAMTFVPIMHEAAARLSATFQFGSGAE